VPQVAKMNHAELVSKDPAATQRFMEKAFGLKFRVMDLEKGPYRIHGRDEGAESAEVGIRSPRGPEGTGTISYFTIPNIDEALMNVKEAGGKVIMPKTEIPGSGWLAIFVAPGEVAQGVFQDKTG
jgi:uncharacterized protein